MSSLTFSDFAQTVLQPLERTPKKLEQTRILAEFFQQTSPDEVSQPLYLLLGQLGPIYRNPEFHFGLEMLLYALSEVLPTTPESSTNLFGEEDGSQRGLEKKKLKQHYKQLGDVGALAQEVVTERQNFGMQSPNLSVPRVYDLLWHLAHSSGEGSQQDKITQAKELFLQLDPLSARYVARIIIGDVRLGVSDKTILDALSWSVTGDKSLREQLDNAYQIHPDIGTLAETLLKSGVDSLNTIDVELGVPILPALCDRLKTTQEMVDKMGEVFAEPKYDGTRLQIHWNAKTGELHTYTRNLEESTHMFPEMKSMLECIPAESIIFDAEAVGYDTETGELLVFQETIKRKRKHDIESFALEIPLKFFVFDVLLVDGKSLIKSPLEERKIVLAELMSDCHRDLVIAPSIRSSDPVEIKAFHEEQLGGGLEGVVVKRVDGLYQSGRKAFNWVKLKESEGTAAKLSDTIDAVVLGYYFGRGKRTEFGVGAFLIGVLDAENDRIVTIAKIGTGLSDAQWRELKARADELLERGKRQESSAVGIVIPDALQPDVLLPPDIVVEVAADEITRSPMHSAGLALRFPRLKNFRDDKSPADITTTEELAKIS